MINCILPIWLSANRTVVYYLGRKSKVSKVTKQEQILLPPAILHINYSAWSTQKNPQHYVGSPMEPLFRFILVIRLFK